MFIFLSDILISLCSFINMKELNLKCSKNSVSHPFVLIHKKQEEEEGEAWMDAYYPSSLIRQRFKRMFRAIKKHRLDVWLHQMIEYYGHVL